MEDRRQKKISPFWHSDAPGLLFFLFGPVILAILVMILLPVLQLLGRADSWAVFAGAATAGVVGVLLLFLARLPLYRQRQFFTFGPRLLDTRHRRLYRLAYWFIGVSVALLLALLVVLRW